MQEQKTEPKQTMRPRLDVGLYIKIKEKYPKETALMNHEEAVAWALNKFLGKN